MLTALMLLAWSSVVIGVEPQSEYKIKSAYLYNFLQFTQVPNTHFIESPGYDICIVGEHRFGRFLDPLPSRDVRGRPIKLHFFQRSGDLGICEMLFISRSEASRLAELLDTASRNSALTVSDIDDFAARGGIIGLTTEGTHVRFEINHQAAQANNITISAKLLELGRIVTEQRSGGEQ